MLKSSARVSGGGKLRSFLRKATKPDERVVEVGFFPTARYQDGTYVATVAAQNEFGTERIPQRPFFRNTIADLKIDKTLKDIVSSGIDPATGGVINPDLADHVGIYVQNKIQQNIVDLREPPNAPLTLRLKYPKTNPLINTGFMRLSVTYGVD